MKIRNPEKKGEAINIIFDGELGVEGPRFIEVENDRGESLKVGEWIKRLDGYLTLRIDQLPKELKRRTKMDELKNCHDCNAKPGEPHLDGCDIEICSSCGEQRLGCNCNDHDPLFARWTGIWPGKAEADFLGVDLNTFWPMYGEKIFIKPKDKLNISLTKYIEEEKAFIQEQISSGNSSKQDSWKGEYIGLDKVLVKIQKAK